MSADDVSRDDEPARGADLAREALAAARAARARTPTDDERARAAKTRAERRRANPRRGDGRGGDPVLFGAAINGLLDVRGWRREAAVHGVLARWASIAGPEVADHCRPVALRDGELILEAESTAWATQLRLLAGQIRQRVAADLGEGIVTAVRVHGPTSARGASGGWRVQGGRGPRDTYG